ncbi:MAG: GGDEF domain-containing protein [Chitinispirillaceae bacterium]
MPIEQPFEGFKEHVQEPLVHSDERSVKQVMSFFSDITQSKPTPFSTLVQRITGRSMPEREALKLWHRILEHKSEMEKKLNRRVGIQTAALDYSEMHFESLDFTQIAQSSSTETVKEEKWLQRVYSPEYHMEKLKEELLRSRRYKHALSAILLDVDEFHKVNESLSYQTGDKILTIIIKIINKTIRNVDILTRYSGDRFLIILPNTNRREALELAERLRGNVNKRTTRIEGLSTGVTLTLSVAQSSADSNSSRFMRQLENALIEGKKKKRNTVHPA